MIFFVLACIFYFIGMVISNDHLVVFLPKSVQKAEFSLSKMCREISILALMCSVGYYFLLESYNIDFWIIFKKLPFSVFYFPLYLLTKIYFAITNSRVIDATLYIKDKRETINSFRYFDCLLIDYEHRLFCSERKLNTLKAFSILPIVLLLLSSAPEIFSLFSTGSFRHPSDYTNVFLIALVISYCYSTYTCYQRCQNLSFIIKVIKIERLKAEFPDVLENKKEGDF